MSDTYAPPPRVHLEGLDDPSEVTLPDLPDVRREAALCKSSPIRPFDLLGADASPVPDIMRSGVSPTMGAKPNGESIGMMPVPLVCELDSCRPSHMSYKLATRKANMIPTSETCRQHDASSPVQVCLLLRGIRR